MSLYLDDPQAVEKSATAEARESKRQKAIEKLSDSLDTFEMRINTGSRVRKWQYDDIKKGLGSSFYWSLDSRKDFAQHMTEQGWIAEVCDTEADVKIARDAQSRDIIISGDSDMLGYANIHTLWRPVSKSVILVYSLPDILKTIGFTRAQLTALAVVSKNDYQRNIKGLDPHLIVAAYLSDPTVISKNKLEATFKDSIRDFIEMRQQVMNPLRPNPTQAVYHALQERFRDLCQKRESLKDVKGSEAQPTPVEEPIGIPRSFNRYRTVESPANVAKDTRVPSPPPEDSGHPALARTRIPRHRERFSFQERTRKRLRAPPPRMKQMTLKFYKQPPETSAKSPPKPKTNVEKAPASAKKPLTEMKKAGLVRSLAWRHPTVSLKVGTINTNTKRVFFGWADINNPLSDYTRIYRALSNDAHSVRVRSTECSRLAADKKREAQRLIGIFVETLRIRMDSAEEALRIELPPEKLTVSEEQRTKARRDAVSDTERKILDHLDLKGFGARDLLPKDKDEDEDKDKGKKEKTSPGIVVNYLIDWLVTSHFYDPVGGEVRSRSRCPILLRADLDHRKLRVPQQAHQQQQANSTSHYLTAAVCIVFRTGVGDWIGSKEPDFIIKHFICDVGSEGLTSRQKKKAGHRAAVRLWTLDDIRSRLQQFLQEDEKKVKKNIKDDDEGEFHPAMYKEKGYPGVDVKDIRTLTLDAGQACIVGAFAHLPEEIAKRVKGKEVAKDLSSSDMEGVVATGPLDPASVSTSSVSSASTMASLLTPLDTSGGSSSNDSAPRSAKNVSSPSISPQPSTANPALSPRPVEQEEEMLKAFYNGPDGKYKRNHWDMQRARHGEFQLIAHRLLGIVGGGLGILSDPSKPVIIGIGLGKFGTKSGLTSLHSTFLSYFVPLGYLLDLQHPDYLYPIAPVGSMPWKEASSGLGTPSTTGSTATKTATTSGLTKVALRSKGQRKRSSTASSLKQAPSKSARN
ncbi:hypothetical protein KI688_007302 [Linnemannia hyalina]|uniref:XPG-I domain-containing protein n=1 Tax=Linnemannia hyalina TaxID=64524 RepID=A0A9P7XIX0_9FUNG|nr:hypothetical protein KI688_007302 [Linnemannia hyalina]